MPTPVASSEIVSRFITQSNWIRPSSNTVKYAAFMPNPRDGKTSIFRIDGISEDEIWDIGDREVATRRGRPIVGRANIVAGEITAKQLKILPSEPPIRHADITCWPEEKGKQKEIALELARDAKLLKK